MKRATLILAALLVAASLAGCSKEKETEKPTEAVTTAPQTETKATEAVTEKQSEDSMNKTKELQGLVLSASMNTVEVQTARGKKLTFSTQNAKVSIADGIKVDNQITIKYTGVIDGTDTAKVTVTEIADADASAEKIVKSETEATEAETADPNAKGGVMSGSITDITAEKLVIVADDGDSYYFTLQGCKMVLRNGIQDGNYVTVTYTGDVYGPDMVPATMVVDNEQNDAKITKAEGEQSVTGTVSDASMNNVTIYTDEGESLTFSIDGVPVSLDRGIYLEEYITVNYTGSLSGEDTSSAKVVSITAGTTSSSDTQTEETVKNPETEAADTTDKVETEGTEAPAE